MPTPFQYSYDRNRHLVVPVLRVMSGHTKCNGQLNVKQYNKTALANAYVDLGHWGMITPYIGAGLGVNANTIHGHR